MESQNKNENWGGKRAGAGRKSSGVETVNVNVRLSLEMVKRMDTYGSRTKFISEAVQEKLTSLENQ